MFKIAVQFSRSVMSDSLRPHGLQHTRLPRPITNSGSLLKLTFIESVIPSNHLILCGPLLLLPSIFPSIRIFSDESVLCSVLCCCFFLYPSALCWKYSEMIFETAGIDTLSFAGKDDPPPETPSLPAPVHLGER